MPGRVYVETYGCQMNLADTELLLGHLQRAGYARTGDPAAADVILVNTCAVRGHAEERVIGRLGNLAQYKRQRPQLRLGLAGCLAQSQRERLLGRLPYLDFIVGPDAYRRLPRLLAGDPFVDVRLDRRETYADISPERAAGIRAWISITRGCDRFCTFCIVPYVRGRERSLPVAVILEQVRQAVAAGFREVMFLGQTVNAYRDGDCDFATLLRRTDAIAGLARIRFTSPHPADMTAATIEAMATCARVCPQLHLPVQSGADRILARMARGYTAGDYLRLVERLRAAIPRLALSTDLIVGFPGEEEADFRATRDLMRAVRFDHAFMFKYSPRAGTKAFAWGDSVREEEKQRRLQEIVALQEAIAAEINRGQVGRTVEVLVEGPARRPQGWLAGKSAQFKTTVFPASGQAAGDLVGVRVTESTAHTLRGLPLSAAGPEDRPATEQAPPQRAAAAGS